MEMYFIAVLCPQDINAQVLKWKEYMREHYGCHAALRSPAHITIILPCWMDPQLETGLLGLLNEFAVDWKAFPVQLSGFSSFRPRVIFVSVKRNHLLETLHDQLFSRLNEQEIYPFKKDERAFHPHVTIATRDLNKKSYYEAWDHFKEKKYESEWTATGLSLLRHNKKNWDVIATSQFK